MGVSERLTANICCHLLAFAGVFRIMVAIDKSGSCLINVSQAANTFLERETKWLIYQ